MKPSLGLWDTVSMIVGIVIGAGIFETAPLIFSTVGHSGLALGVWVAGGLLSFIGALCYAELACAYPKSGGDYVYLTRAYGSWMGFLFGWAQLAIILTGSIGMMAYIFADYAADLWNLPRASEYIYAAFAVVAFSILNAFGLSMSKGTQNALSVIKILGLNLIVVSGAFAASRLPSPPAASLAPAPVTVESLSLALVFVLYTYGGWNDAAFVASEMKDKEKNIPRALMLGTLAITFIYLLVNLAYLAATGLQGAIESKAIAADVLRAPFGAVGSTLISLLVMVSALGAVNGLVFTGSRIYSAMGHDHAIFARLSHWHPRWRSPVWSIAAQAFISALLVVIVGSPWGRQMLSLPEGRSGFETLLICSAPVFWLFFLLTGLSIFVLRRKDPDLVRPFRVPLYPMTPLVFCLTCAFMLYRSASFAGHLSLIGVLFLMAGIPLYWFSNRSRHVTNLNPVTIPTTATT